MRPFPSFVRLLFVPALLVSATAAADPPTPSGAHPRLFMSAPALAAYQTNATTSGTAAAGLVAQCQDTIDNPSSYTARGGEDGNYWPQSSVACAFAYVATQQSKYLTQALLYWNASLNDDETIDDHLGCVQGVDTNWQTWAASPSGSVPPVILTINHDDQYPMRWYGPDVALTYDWLYGAPGVSAALLTQTRVCLSNWIDYYTGYGYHRTEPGANYNAGYIVSKALGAIAIGTDDASGAHLWTQILDDDFGQTLVTNGLSGLDGGVGGDAAVMVGGDWGEGWEYGALSVLEYATATSALEAQGAPLPSMDAWADSLVLRNLYATTPDGAFEWCGNGDCDITTPNKTLNVNELDAVLISPASSQAASWALSAKTSESLAAMDYGSNAYVYNALAEIRSGTAAPFAAATPAPSLWYLAEGTRQVYARTAWNDPTAFWGVFMSEPQLNSDHQHLAASNFVFSRGSDDLVVDSIPYGGFDSFDTNAVTADSANFTGDYAFTQGPWSTADLPWARGTSDATYAARSDFANAFIFSSMPSDIPYAHREWTMLPEGEVVLLDRVHTSDASRNMYVTFHVNTGGGGLSLSNGLYTGTVGSSEIAIHPVKLSGATPVLSVPPVGDCTLSCSYPCGACDTARFAVDEYRVTVPGTWAVAIHVIDGLGASEAPATVDSIDDATVDPSGQNTGVIGASVFRSSKQSYVVASSAVDGVSPATMTYGVPGASPGRHVVFDAPEASDGTSKVTTAADSGRCTVTITAGSGGGFAGHPLMFQVAAASGGCTATDSTNVGSASPPPGGGIDGGSSGGGSDGGGGADGGGNADGAGGSTGSSGCSCTVVAGQGAGARRWRVCSSVAPLRSRVVDDAPSRPFGRNAPGVVARSSRAAHFRWKNRRARHRSLRTVWCPIPSSAAISVCGTRSLTAWTIASALAESPPRSASRVRSESCRRRSTGSRVTAKTSPDAG